MLIYLKIIDFIVRAYGDCVTEKNESFTFINYFRNKEIRKII